jgi:hypothetical protein
MCASCPTWRWVSRPSPTTAAARGSDRVSSQPPNSIPRMIPSAAHSVDPDGGLMRHVQPALAGRPGPARSRGRRSRVARRGACPSGARVRDRRAGPSGRRERGWSPRPPGPRPWTPARGRPGTRRFAPGSRPPARVRESGAGGHPRSPADPDLPPALPCLSLTAAARRPILGPTARCPRRTPCSPARNKKPSSPPGAPARPARYACSPSLAPV